MTMFAMAQMIIWSCVKPELETPAVDNVNPEDVVFSATVEATKTAPVAGGVVSWTMDDEIGVYDGTNYVKATVLSVEGSNITFSASVNASASSYIAVSPYEAALADGTFTLDGGKVKVATSAAQTAGKQVISVASISSASEKFAFKNVGNLLRFKVNKAAVKKVKIAGANGEKIAGTVSVDPATGEATGALSATEIVVDVTPGVDNFIALAPGVSLPNGFAITLYGSEVSEAGYEGEVASAGALTLTRNQMVNLGLIDGWIDNYKLWQAGKPITIAGVEFSKSNTGLDGTLVSAKDADVDVNTFAKATSGAFFLETSGEYKFTSNSIVKLGASGAPATVLLIGRYDNNPVRYEPASHYLEYVQAGLAMKNISMAPVNAYGVLTSTIEAAKYFYADNCSFNLAKGKYLINFHSSRHAFEKIRVTNCNIKFNQTDGLTARADFIYTTSNPNLDEFKECIIENNIFYNVDKVCRLCVVPSSGKTPTSQNRQMTDFKIVNNTFYNFTMHTTVQGNSMGSLEFKNNIIYRTEGTEDGIIAWANDVTEFPYTYENNVSNFRAYYFNPNSGAYCKTKILLPATEGEIFKTVEPSTWTFIPVDAYSSCGAKR